MTVSSSGDRVSYAGNGSTTVFAFPYYFLDEDDLTVIVRVNSTGVETVQTIATHYTVLGAGDSAGGSVTMLTAPVSGETLTILRELDATQELDLIENDALPAESLERALDKLTMLAQQSLSTAGRAILAPKTDSAALSTTLPSSVTRASKYFGFNASGEPVALDPPTVDDTSLVVVAGTEPEHANGRIWIDTSTVGWLIWSQSDGTDYQEMFRTSTTDGALQIAQSIVMAGATGGDPGAGKINAAGIEINGVALSASPAGRFLRRTVYTAGDTWTKGDDVGFVKVTAVGGGGGGAGSGTTSNRAGAGGGGGAYAEKIILAASLGSSETVTIGAAGTAGTASGAGGNGGTSSFGAHVSCPGGDGGLTGSQQGGPGGTTTDGDINVNGGTGAPTNVGAALGGPGGSTPLGVGGAGVIVDTAGLAGTGFGSGGSGGVTTDATGSAGGAGAPGVVIVEEFS